MDKLIIPNEALSTTFYKDTMIKKTLSLCFFIIILILYNCSDESSNSDSIDGLENFPYELLYGKIAFSFGQDYLIIEIESQHINRIKWKDEWWLRGSTQLSPLGDKIVFIGLKLGYYKQIFTLTFDGLDPIKLTEFDIKTPQNNYPVWSPDGTKIFYIRGSEKGRIYSMNDNGSNQLNITEFNVNGPVSISEDLNLIAVSKDDNFGYPTENIIENIYIFNRQDSSFTKLTFHDKILNAHDPIFSPDELKVAYILSHGPNDYPLQTPPYFSRIVIVNTDGTGEKTLIELPEIISRLAWAPNSDQLVFSYGTSESNIYLLNTNSQDLMQLTHGNGFSSPAWLN